MDIKIKHLSITNFKGIKSLELDFTYENSDKILDNILFYGINGSGKSTILEAIYICLSFIYDAKKNNNEKVINSYLPCNILLNDDMIYNNEDKFKLSLHLVVNNEVITMLFTYYRKNSYKEFIYNPPLKYFPEDIIDEFTYLSSSRYLNPTNIYTPGNWNEIRQDKENNYSSVKQYLVSLITDKKVETLSSKNEGILENIKKSFKIFFPEKEFLEKLSRTDDRKDYRLMIKNEDGSIVDLDQLSSGEREVIAFFTYLSIETNKNSILIIDEPELHLHSKWQSIILYAIHKIFPNSQVFLATHSSEIHQSASESELFELVKDN